MDAANVANNIAKGIPTAFGANAMGFDIMEGCPQCGRAYPTVSGPSGPGIAEHLQSHAADHDRDELFGTRSAEV
jgi:hypothetical protein